VSNFKFRQIATGPFGNWCERLYRNVDGSVTLQQQVELVLISGRTCTRFSGHLLEGPGGINFNVKVKCRKRKKRGRAEENWQLLSHQHRQGLLCVESSAFNSPISSFARIVDTSKPCCSDGKKVV
jgi:hypothetical protein